MGTKFFEITFDESGLDFLNADNLKLILDAALTEEDTINLDIRVRDLTNKAQYLEEFKIVVIPYTKEVQDVVSPLDSNDSLIGDVEEDHGSHNESVITDVQKRNEEIKERLEKEEKVVSPHIAPGTGKLCEDPKIFKDTLSTGGSISFCPACGHQYFDTDLLQK